MVFYLLLIATALIAINLAVTIRTGKMRFLWPGRILTRDDNPSFWRIQLIGAWIGMIILAVATVVATYLKISD
jgi:hypothetical protein